MKRFAVIGAGLSGLIIAKKLSQRTKVVVFEKARGVGGRMSTRYADPFYFDHGTQYFTAHTLEFQNFLKPYVDKGSIAEWKGEVMNLEIGKKENISSWLEPHFVASPNMNNLCKSLAEGMDIRTFCEVAPLEGKIEKMWHLLDKEGAMLGEFDWVISTTPPAQTLRLFNRHIIQSHPLRTARMQGCYALMLGFNKPWDRHWIAAKVNNNPIDWISVNSSKPGRDSKVTCLVAHSRNDWAEAHMDQDMNVTEKLLMEQFVRVTDYPADNADYVALHRWRYATVDNAKKIGSYIDKQLRLGATGDWCESSRIEEVWVHATKLADQIV